MDHPLRASTLQALAEYIEAQKNLITRAQADIDRLRQLQDIERPIDIRDISEPSIALGLGHLVTGVQDLPESIEWSLYDSVDPAPFRDLSHNASQKYILSNEPIKTQHTQLSELQLLVKTTRQTMVDPVLADFALLSEPEDLSEDDALSPEELRRQQEHAKIRELKKRKIHFGGLTLPFRDSAVFIRRDMEDESADVDMSLDDTNILNLGDDAFHTPPPPLPLPKPRRSRPSKPHVTKSPHHTAKTPPPTKALQSVSPEPKSKTGSNGKRPSKPKPETYKQAWSDSEQHLLERLLKEIPDGEKNRWVKISKAMGGRRTPRQVASRVQKYFEKLKRFGLDITDRKSVV